MERSLAPLPPDRFTPAHARHLLRRAGLGPPAALVADMLKLGPQGATDAVIAQLDLDDNWPSPEVDPDVVSPPSRQEQQMFLEARRSNNEEQMQQFQQLRNLARRDDQQMLERLRRWWLRRIVGSETPLRENLTLLWHGHFATRHRDVRDAYLMFQQNQMFRADADRFDSLARGLVRDPAMLRFLNNDRNVKRRPNENLAREFMELFTLGVGNYAERDIKEGARALTGYHVQDNEFTYRPAAHDSDAKTILGRTGNFDGDAFVDLLLDQPACPRFVAMKLYDHFVLDVADHPELAPPVSRVVIDRLADTVQRYDFDLRPVLRQLFASRHFHDPAVIGNKVKSPAALLAGAARTLHTPPRDAELLSGAMRLMGQQLFDPPSVAGWDGGPAWINTSTLFIRQNTVAYLITGSSPQQRRGANRDEDPYDPTPLLEGLPSTDSAALVDHLVDQLIGEHVALDRRRPLAAFLDGREATSRDTVLDLLLLITAMPEYQLVLNETTPWTRRQFLNRSLALISTVSTAPAFLSRSSMLMADTAALNPNLPGADRVLVVIQLSGGNDGLNTVVPFGFDAYHKARPQLRIGDDQALVLDDKVGIGLHPSMTAVHDMVAAKRCAVVHGVGYPNPNRSHFASMDIWHAGISLDEPAPGSSKLPRGTGWIGRALDACDCDEALACIAIGSEAPPATHGKKVQAIAFERSEMFRWAAGEKDKDLAATYSQLQNAPGVDNSGGAPGGAASFVFRTAMDAQVASSKVRAAVAKPTSTDMPRTDLARQLASVANMIRAELPTRVYYVAMGGFDTHAGQLGRHPNLLRDFSSAVAAFYAELDATGHSARVTTLAFSEFGRRVAQNASTGTDHGAAGPMFVFGNHLAPGSTGLIGEHPSLDKLDANGDVTFHTDFRSVYADLLSNWMKIDARAALGRAYKPVKVIA